MSCLSDLFSPSFSLALAPLSYRNYYNARMQFTFIETKVITASDFKVNGSEGNARLVSASLREHLSNSTYISILVVAILV